VVSRLARRLKAVFRGGALDGQLDAELQFHIDLEAARYVGQGMSPDQARTTALRAFGGVERVREECRDARKTSWAETVARNARYAVRLLRRQPGYAVAVIATLGLGIGANSAIFSVINGVLLRPLPYAESERLVLLRQSAQLAGQEQVPVSIRELYDYREQTSDFSGIVEFHQMSFDLIRRGEPDRVTTGVVSSNFFDVLGVKPVAGRNFVAADERHGAEAVLLLSHSYWKTRFGGDLKIVGQVFQMNDRPHTVIGVLPPVPLYPQECDVYMPTIACPFRARGEEQIASNRRAFGALQVFGRLKSGATPEHAGLQVATVADRFRREHPESYKDQRGFSATTVGVLGELTRNARPMLLVLLGATALVLLLACANVASLTVARTLNRERELSLRTALGASRRQLIGQLLTESTLLGVAGGLVGLIVSRASLGALTTFVGRFTSHTSDIAIDGRVLVFTAVVSILTGVAFGALPALITRPAAVAALKHAGASSGASPRRRRLQHALVISQVAVSVVLLTAAGLLLTSFYRLQRVNAGYDPARVLSAEIYGNFTRYATAEASLRLYQPLIERLQQLPGVQSAAIGSLVPLGTAFGPFFSPFEIEGRSAAGRERPSADAVIASNDYFRTLGIPIVGGREFRATDTRESTPVAIISQSMARYWDGADPAGSRINFDTETWYTVVGVAGNVRQYGLNREAIAQVYVPLVQTPSSFAGSLLVRTTDDPTALAVAVRDAVHSLDPDLPVENMKTLEDLRSGFLATPRLTAVLLMLFATLALIITLAGLTGVIATSVSQRTHEFGIRLALGETPGGVLSGVLRQGLLLVAIGLVAGIAASAFAARILTAYLFDTEPSDPSTLVAVAVAFVLAGTVACLGPARRATRVDPMLALRSE
jgi:putative ABC transport system permease protein